jgi:GTP pyrophosphokinase
VYTPKGDIVDLPNGSMPLDFAYRLHSEIGGHVTGVKINGKMSNLNTKLQHGDVVEILTSKTQTAKPNWFEKIITAHARNKLRQQLGKAGEIIPKMRPPKSKK